MKGVRFQAVLDLHRASEDTARRRIGMLEGERAVLANALNAFEAERAAAVLAEVHPFFHEQLARFTLAIGLRIGAATAAVRAKETEIEQARVILRAAHRQVATFNKLQELDRRELTILAERRTARAADEFALRRRSFA
jgi:flagellar export protein FliJ